MKKLGLLVCFCLWIFSAAGSEPECFRTLATHFFNNDKAIMQALSLHRVTESSWTPIVRDLQHRSGSILPAVKARARRLDNNPLDPFQPAAAEKLLMYTLLEVFQQVMNSYLITNSSDISEMFDYIRRNQPLWPECFASEKKQE